MESVFATILGLALRVICDSTTSLKVGSTLVGLWEGVVLYHFLHLNPYSRDPYFAFGLRLFLDYAIWRSVLRYVIIVFWTALGYVVADVLPPFWYEYYNRRRSLRRLSRRLRSVFSGTPQHRVRFYEEPTSPVRTASAQASAPAHTTTAAPSVISEHTSVISYYVPRWRRGTRALPGSFLDQRYLGYSETEASESTVGLSTLDDDEEDDLYGRRRPTSTEIANFPSIPTEDTESVSSRTGLLPEDEEDDAAIDNATTFARPSRHIQHLDDEDEGDGEVGTIRIIPPPAPPNMDWEVIQVESPTITVFRHSQIQDDDSILPPPEDEMGEIPEADGDPLGPHDYESLADTVAESTITEGPNDDVLRKAATLRKQATQEKKESLRLWKEHAELLAEGRAKEALLVKIQAREIDKRIQKLHKKAEHRVLHVRKGSQTVGELNVDGLEYEEAYGRIEDALYDAIQRGEQKLRVTVALTENKISQRRHPLMVRLAEDKWQALPDNDNANVIIITLD